MKRRGLCACILAGLGVKKGRFSSMADWSIALSLSDFCLREERKDLVYPGEVRIDFLLLKET